MSSLRHQTRLQLRIAATIATAATAALILSACSTGSTASSGSSASAVAKDSKLAALVPSSIKKTGELSFGALWQTPPVIGTSTTNSKVPVGIAPDLSNDIAGLLGLKATWKNMQWPAQLPGVESGNVDALFGQVSDTAERETSVVDLVPYSQTDYTFLTASGNPKKLGSKLSSACGTTIGVATGSTMAAMVAAATKSCTADGKAAIKAADYPDASSAISALKAGNVDAWINDSASNADAAKSGGLTSVPIAYAQTKAYDPGLGGIAVSKSNPGLSKAIAGALKKLIANGTYAKVMKKYDASSIEIVASKVKVNPLTGTAAGAKA
jgi:ABC-type amino acid transport substrate-binding protein